MWKGRAPSFQNTTLPAEIVHISAGKSTSLAAIIPGKFLGLFSCKLSRWSF
jgi:hypothetical protein